ncbi:hypothetical protein PCANC_14114 [Puccinia coronata f. sp. avenae]|uniref:Uncharacterized protein n=1 Tax=Puccinia coronata f. sp. avenae TaxID=200324 RepID=A0A2N5VRV1_9BASI|nr:hypothetical protein PCANC_14114 [Puccinia coronata f. sp. avenae]
MSEQTNTGSSSKKIATNLAKIGAVMERVFVLWLHFLSRDIIYVLDPVKQVVQTPECRRNNLAVVSVLTSTSTRTPSLGAGCTGYAS